MGGIESDEDIGEFVIANGLNEDVAVVPETSLYLLDKKMIGKLQRKNDGGVILPNQNFNAYFGNTNFKQKWLPALSKTLIEKKVLDGVSKYRITGSPSTAR